jgi:hypothetical protein
VPNAFELLVGRGLITPEEAQAVHAQLQDDVDNQRLMPTSLELDHVFADAHELSRQYTAKFLARSLDLVHVAAARVLRCTSFVSGDDHQLAVAKASCLTTVDIKQRVRRGK